MSLTVTIRCQACGNEEKTLNADAVWLKYPVPCAIEGACQKCNKDELYLVQVGGSISGPRALSLSLTVKHTPQTQAMLKDMIRPFPNVCPNCDWKHPSEMFRLTSGAYSCMRCGYVLKESDMWPEVIDG